MDNDNISIENKKSVFDIYIKGKNVKGGDKKIKRDQILKYLEEERKIVNQIKDGNYDSNCKPQPRGSSIKKAADATGNLEASSGKIGPGKKLLSVFESQAGAHASSSKKVPKESSSGKVKITQ